VSVVAFPGLSLTHHEQEESTAGVHKAFERGINYFDVAPAYGKDGKCEIQLGVALQGIKRDDYFLACKTKMRDKEGAQQELDRSLKRLKTDHFDLYQLHCLIRPEEDVMAALGPGGAMETILKAKEQGKIRAIGFSAHTTKAALAALENFPFDTAMFPISFVEYFTIGFGKPVLKLAAEQGVAVLAMKAMCRGLWPQDMERTRKWWYRSVEEKDEVDLAWRFVLSQEPVAAGIPPSFLDLVDKAIDAARDFRPITEEELDKARAIAATCESLFQREEAKVAHHEAHEGPVYPDCPHECFGGYA
jgi:aryl-alcohol dehydrogenase-like predicted oxidoreductase